MTTTIKAQIRKLDLLMQVKLFIVILKILEEPTIKRTISFEEFLINEEYQSIIISWVLELGIDQVYQRVPDNIDTYTTGQKVILFLKLFICDNGE